MVDRKDVGTEIEKVDGRIVSKQSKRMTVGELELALLRRFPREDAEDWDRTGLLVGDPAALVEGVAVALDPTADAIEAAVAAGANVLLTHHPVFLEPPSRFSPSRDVATASGVNVYRAIATGVALVNFHTALDVSDEAVRLLPGMLNLDFERTIVPAGRDGAKGYGQLCSVRADDAPFKLSHLAARCTSVFGRPPRVWGDFRDIVNSVVVANGSVGNVVDACLKQRVDCLVCGEVRYHTALDAAQAGLKIIEIGHDASELPLAALLATAAVDAGVESSRVSVIDQGSNWTTLESTRI